MDMYKGGGASFGHDALDVLRARKNRRVGDGKVGGGSVGRGGGRGTSGGSVRENPTTMTRRPSPSRACKEGALGGAGSGIGGGRVGGTGGGRGGGGNKGKGQSSRSNHGSKESYNNNDDDDETNGMDMGNMLGGGGRGGDYYPDSMADEHMHSLNHPLDPTLSLPPVPLATATTAISATPTAIASSLTALSSSSTRGPFFFELDASEAFEGN